MAAGGPGDASDGVGVSEADGGVSEASGGGGSLRLAELRPSTRVCCTSVVPSASVPDCAPSGVVGSGGEESRSIFEMPSRTSRTSSARSSPKSPRSHSPTRGGGPSISASSSRLISRAV